MAHNWLNDTARKLNNKIYQRRQQGPSLATIGKWHREFLALGLDRRMSFYSYRQSQMREWYSKRQQRLNNQRKK